MTFTAAARHLGEPVPLELANAVASSQTDEAISPIAPDVAVVLRLRLADSAS